MKIRPGKNLLDIGLAVVVVAVLSFQFWFLVWLIPIVLLAVVPLVVIDYRELKKSFANTSVLRKMPAIVGRDLPFPVELTIVSGSPEALVGEVRDLVPPNAVPRHCVSPLTLEQNQFEYAFTTEFKISIRGAYTFGPVWIRLRSGYRLLEAQQSFDNTAQLKILPENYVARSQLDKDTGAEAHLLDKLTRSREWGVGTEFDSLAEYRMGDDPRRIDWRTTARYRRPIVRRFQIERHRDLIITLDSGRMMGSETGRGTKIDCAVDSALMLSRVALESGDRCGIGIFDSKVMGYLPPVSGLRSLRPLVESVYDIRSRWQESDFGPMYATLQARQWKRALIVVLSDIVDVETSGRFRAALMKLAKRHVVLFAALQTPLLTDYLERPVESTLDGFRKAVTFRLLREREQALHSLKRSGVHVIDVEPQQLTVPLINEFIQLRQRNLA